MTIHRRQRLDTNGIGNRNPHSQTLTWITKWIYPSFSYIQWLVNNVTQISTFVFSSYQRQCYFEEKRVYQTKILVLHLGNKLITFRLRCGNDNHKLGTRATFFLFHTTYIHLQIKQWIWNMKCETITRF